MKRGLSLLAALMLLVPIAAAADVSPIIRVTSPQPYTYLLDAPTPSAQPIGIFFNGVFAAVTGGYTGAYAAVNIGSIAGFMETAQLEMAPAENPVSAMLPVVTIQNPYGTGLHMRVSPDIGTEESPSYSAGLFANGTQVTVLGVLRDWAYVQVGGLTGYMRLFGLPDLSAYALPDSTQPSASDLYYKQLTKQDSHGYTTTATMTETAPGQYTVLVGVSFNGVMLNSILIGYNAYAEDEPLGFLAANGWVNDNPADGAPVSFTASFPLPAGTTRIVLRQVWSRSGRREDGRETPIYEDNLVFGLKP